MDITIIKKSLENYLTTVTDETEKSEVMNSLVEIDELTSIYCNSDIWKNSCYIVTPTSISDLLNLLTYDDYGRLKKSTGSVSIEQYTDIVRKKYFLDELTHSCISLGYDIISDLWNDNEHYGNHNPDGSFCP